MGEREGGGRGGGIHTALDLDQIVSYRQKRRRRGAKTCWKSLRHPDSISSYPDRNKNLIFKQFSVVRNKANTLF